MRRDLVMSLVAVLSIPALVSAQAGAASKCAPDNVGLKLPPGFCASIFADTLRGARELAVAPNGDVFVASHGQGQRRRVRAARAESRAVVPTRSRSSRAASRRATSRCSTAISIPRCFRLVRRLRPAHRLVAAAGRRPRSRSFAIRSRRVSCTPSGPPDTIVSGLPSQPGHTTRNFAITRDGVMYVNVGSATNSCQETDRDEGVARRRIRAPSWTRAPASGSSTRARRIRRRRPACTSRAEFATRSASRSARSTASCGRRSTAATISAVRRGNWSFDAKYNAENPAEELLQVNEGDDFGWPYCYFSVEEHHLVLAPEYGGDGKKVGECAKKKEPVATFPGHWAPNALFFYTGSAFPGRSTRTARSSRSTVRGIVRRSRPADTTSCSSR